MHSCPSPGTETKSEILPLIGLCTHFVTWLCPQKSNGFDSTPFFFSGGLSIPTPKADVPARVCFGADSLPHISIFKHVKKKRSYVYVTPSELNRCRFQRRIRVTSERCETKGKGNMIAEGETGLQARGLGAAVWCDVTVRRLRTHASAHSTVRVQDSGVR